jgi:hypothetical protein
MLDGAWDFPQHRYPVRISRRKVLRSFMSFSLRPDRDLTADLHARSMRSEIARIEHAVFTKAPCDMAWKLFSDWRRWPELSDIYGSPIEWKGSPWAPGSRMQFDIVRPVRARMDRVITICSPPRCVAWINHVYGYTMEQWVLFDQYAGGGTRISTWIELTGAELCPDGKHAGEVVKGVLEKWFSNFCARCDEVAGRL